ncbi:hypothetical protein ACOME3_003697 [Neoechinorhynchus agilis]
MVTSYVSEKNGGKCDQRAGRCEENWKDEQTCRYRQERQEPLYLRRQHPHLHLEDLEALNLAVALRHLPLEC